MVLTETYRWNKKAGNAPIEPLSVSDMHRQEPFPPLDEMDRDDLLDLFIIVTNVCRPLHHKYAKYYSASFAYRQYPLSRDDVNFGVTRNYWGSVRATMFSKYAVNYNTRQTITEEISEAYLIGHTAHEATHIAEPNHSPDFYRELAYHLLRVHDSMTGNDGEGVLKELYPHANADDVLTATYEHVHEDVVDLRYMTVKEYRELLKDLTSYKLQQ